ncbi:hypothetical protein HDU93_004933, partial [Gonapodya sp. JEL0774]
RSKTKRKFRAIKRDNLFAPVEVARAGRVSRRLANKLVSVPLTESATAIPSTYDDGRPRPFNFLDFVRTGSKPEILAKTGDRIAAAREREDGRRGRSSEVKNIGGANEENPDTIVLGDEEEADLDQEPKVEDEVVKMEEDAGPSLTRLRRLNPTLYLSRNQMSRIKRGKSKVRLPGVKGVKLGKNELARRGMQRSW